MSATAVTTALRRAAPALALLVSMAATAATVPPATLAETGYGRAGALGFTPQYPLWSDGAEKRRWVALPPGTAIDARQPDAWQFPRGTRLWKEFAVDGRPVETRYIERRADGSWLYASYVWNATGTEALLAPERGAVLAVAGAPGGRYVVPGRADCAACHAGAAVPVLGLSALQLSPARDPLAANARPPRAGDVDLPELAARGLLRGLPPALLRTPPRIAADTPTERAALGTLHANCAHCHHRAGGQVPLALTLAQRVAAPRASRDEVVGSLLDTSSRYRPGTPPAALLALRMGSRQPQLQMPPLGTQVPDPEGLALIDRWLADRPLVDHLLTPELSPSPRKDP
jgi:hypothetical protein